MELLQTSSIADKALLMMNYRTTDKNKKDPVFNEYRNNYLLYLTIFNDILIKTGPISFMDLTTRSKKYPNLTNIKLHPSLALQGLITVGALNSDPKTTSVSIPDQVN
jgi:hypothetical protein